MGSEHRGLQFRAKERLQLVDRHQVQRFGLSEKDLKAITRRAARVYKLLQSSETWVEAPIGDKWVAAYRLVSQEGQPVISEFRLFPSEPEKRVRDHDVGRWSGAFTGAKAQAPRGGITARLLRQVRIGEHAKFAGEFLAYLQKQYGRTLFESGNVLGRRGFTPPVAPARSPRGRKGRPDLFYAQIAAVYAKALKSGSRHPVEDVATAFRLRTAHARDMIHQARRRGLLTPSTRQGRREGQLTSRARALLGMSSEPRVMRRSKKVR